MFSASVSRGDEQTELPGLRKNPREYDLVGLNGGGQRDSGEDDEKGWAHAVVSLLPVADGINSAVGAC